MNFNQYIKTLDTCFKSGISREYSYWADLKYPLRELDLDGSGQVFLH